MVDTGVSNKFKKIGEIYSIDLNTFDDVVVLVDKILNVSNLVVGQLSSPNESDLELENDFIHLVELLREGGVEFSQRCKKLVLLIVSWCLSEKNETLWSILIHRLYKRGFSLILVESFIEYYSKRVEYEENEEYSELCVLGNYESTILICCKILRYMSKCLYIEKNEEEYVVCIDYRRDYNVIRRVISVMMGSYLKRGDKWNYKALSRVFHPFSSTYLPCLVLYVIIDMLSNEAKMELLLQLSYIYSDSELMRVVQVEQVAYLSACISRVLYSLKCASDTLNGTLSKALTKSITSGMETLDPIVRMAAMTMAESYSVFMYNNSKVKNESVLLKFDKEYKVDGQSTLHLASYRSKVVVRARVSNSNNKELEEGLSKKIEITEERSDENKKEKGKEMENEAFMDFIFSGVPSIKMKTIDGYVKETWLKPPQHIVQCYERLLSKPARGDVDYECINTNGLDRLEEETVENKILRVSQTLLYLPKVISKKESILEKYAVPLSNVLLKLDDLDLYREKIVEIAKRNGNKIKDTESEGEIENVVSVEPEKLILVSLTLIAYHCPEEVVKYYSSHLFDTDYTLAARITMILCIQYTSMAYNGSLSSEELTKKILNDSMRMSTEENEISKLKSVGIVRESGLGRGMEVKLSNGKNEIKIKNQDEKEVWYPSESCVKNYNNKTIGYLLNSLKTYSKKRESGRGPMDEDVSSAIFETITITISSHKIEDEIIEDVKEMVQHFSSVPANQRFKNTLKMVEIVLSTRQSLHISTR